jgi:hypothetical protein
MNAPGFECERCWHWRYIGLQCTCSEDALRKRLEIATEALEKILHTTSENQPGDDKITQFSFAIVRMRDHARQALLEVKASSEIERP